MTREHYIVRLAAQVRDGDVVNVATPLTASAAFLAQHTHAPSATVMWHGQINPRPHAFARLTATSHDATGAAYGQAEALRLIERGVVTLMFLSPAQLDRHGNVNASRLNGAPLPGGIGTADLVSLVGRLVVYKTGRARNVLVDEVEYVTGSSRANAPSRKGVVALVTAERTHTFRGEPAREREPTAQDLAFLGALDPHGVADLEFGRSRDAALRRLTC
jgi:acyl CoA:acetate/3-ketoacid CoA transferase beta subunit